MPSIVLSPGPNMQAKRKSIWQGLDLENGCITFETKKPKLKGAKYVRECYARKRLPLKKQQAQFWKLINEANDRMLDETTKLLDAGDRKSTRLNSSHPSISRMPSSA